jgi:ribosomal protein L29
MCFTTHLDRGVRQDELASLVVGLKHKLLKEVLQAKTGRAVQENEGRYRRVVRGGTGGW